MFRFRRLFLFLILPVLTLDHRHTPTLCQASATRRHYHQRLRQQQQQHQHEQQQQQQRRRRLVEDVLPRSRVSYTCRGIKKDHAEDEKCQEKPKFIVSWTSTIVDKLKRLGVGPQSTSKLVSKLGDVGDPFFGDHIVAFCGTNCPRVSADDIASLPLSWAAAAKLGAEGQGVPILPLPYNGISPIQSFPVARDRYSVFGMAKKHHHTAARNACRVFQSLCIKAFASEGLSMNAFFNPDGSFVLYDHVESELTRPELANPVLDVFLQLFTKRAILENDAKAGSVRRRLWNHLLKSGPSREFWRADPGENARRKHALTEKILDDVLARVHRVLQSIELIADSKQVVTMAKSVETRKAEMSVRRLGTGALVLTSIGIVAVAAAVAAGGGTPLAAAAIVKSVHAVFSLTKQATMNEAIANDKKHSADDFGSSQNQLRWVRGMLAWVGNWMEPDPRDVEEAARPKYRVKPEMMCAHFAEETAAKFIEQHQADAEGSAPRNSELHALKNCNPFKMSSLGREDRDAASGARDGDVGEEEESTDFVPWDSPLLEWHRAEYKSRFLATFIEFVTADGGCDDMRFGPPEPFEATAEDETSDRLLFRHVFKLPLPKKDEKRKLEVRAWETYCHEIAIETRWWRKKSRSADKAENNRMRCSLVAVEAAEERLTTAEFCKKVWPQQKKKKTEGKTKKVQECEEIVHEKLEKIEEEVVVEEEVEEVGGESLRSASLSE
jgi:hypothetical protein